MAIDWTNPCQRAQALRDAYFALISGQQESLIRHSTSEGDQEVRFTRADVEKLKAEMVAAEEACIVATGGTVTPRRSAIRLGATRRFGFGDY
jgi:hypothetical protein